MNLMFDLHAPHIHIIECDYKKISTILINDKDDNVFSGIIDGNKLYNKQDVFQEFKDVFKIPSYFGYNWDALDECLNDLDWITADKYILIIKDFNNVKAQKKDIKLLIDIMLSVINEWVNGRYYNSSFPTEPTPFHIILHCETGKIQEVIDMLKLYRVLENEGFNVLKI